MAYKPNDHYSKKAKAEGYSARSVYKLQEIQKRFGVLKRGDRVLDLGYFPGSWSQWASKIIQKEGKIVGIDIQSGETPTSVNNGVFLKESIDTFDPASVEVSEFEVVLSDMAPKTTGISDTDHYRSMELCELALGCADKVLKKGGHFVCKVFDGPDMHDFHRSLKDRFKAVKAIRPTATRKSSREVFLVARDKKS